MSRERPIGEGPVGGIGPTGSPNPAAAVPLPQAQERDATLEAGQRAAAPDLTTPPPAPRAAAGVPSGRRMMLSDILGDEGDEGEGAVATGMGPRLVVLHEFVRGKTRGNVVWASDILGLDRFSEASGGDAAKSRAAQSYIRSELKRLTDLGAIREANDQEAQYEQVTFVETQEQAESALLAAQKTISEKDAEIQRLQNLVEQAQKQAAADGGDTPRF